MKYDVKLTGIIEDTFKGCTLFRGYATLRTLYKLSEPGKYQREEEKKRLPEILKFLSDSKFVFFPELIFAWQIDEPDFLQKIKYEQEQGTINLNNEAQIKKAKFTFSRESVEEDPPTKVMSIFLPEQLVDQHPLKRIDGNHRLSSLKEVFENEISSNTRNPILNTVVPFSILLQTENEESQKQEAAFFYLINSKSKALTTEENLRAILSNNNFDLIEKESLLGLNEKKLDILNDIITFVKNENFKVIKDVFNNEIYSISSKILTQLSNPKLDQIKDSIEYIDELYAKNDIDKSSFPFVYEALIIYGATNSKEDTKKFKKWLEETKINVTRFNDVSSLLKSYEENFNKVLNVFVAMPYISHARVNDFNKLFKEVLAEISDNKPYKLQLIPIMRFRGEAQRIDQRLIQKIKECDIFIADITGCNTNVIFEIGLAEGNGKPIILINEENDRKEKPFDEAKLDTKKQIPFDMDKMQWIPYSASGYYNSIKKIMKRNISEILKQNFGLNTEM